MGLSKQHHQELNTHRVPAQRYNELRQQYANDAQALQQIDAYDPNAEQYHAMLCKYREALKVCDEITAVACEAWFNEHYGEL